MIFLTKKSKIHFATKFAGKYVLYKDGAEICTIVPTGRNFTILGRQNFIALDLKDLTAIRRFIKWVEKRERKRIK